MDKQDKFNCKHLECNMDGCYCGIQQGYGYNWCVLSKQNKCEYFEEDKQKEIEEMADILCESKEHNCNGEDCKCLKQATDLFNKGARIINKDKVVLTSEEYERCLKDLEDIDIFCRDINYIRRDNGNRIVTFKEFQDYVELQINKASKETAEKFASVIINDILPKIMNGHSEKALEISMTITNYYLENFDTKKE